MHPERVHVRVVGGEEARRLVGQVVRGEHPEPDAQPPHGRIDAVHVAAQERPLVAHDDDDGVALGRPGQQRLDGRLDLRSSANASWFGVQLASGLVLGGRLDHDVAVGVEHVRRVGQQDVREHELAAGHGRQSLELPELELGCAPARRPGTRRPRRRCCPSSRSMAGSIVDWRSTDSNSVSCCQDSVTSASSLVWVGPYHEPRW